jgi:hypothetical protein
VTAADMQMRRGQYEAAVPSLEQLDARGRGQLGTEGELEREGLVLVGVGVVGEEQLLEAGDAGRGDPVRLARAT